MFLKIHLLFLFSPFRFVLSHFLINNFHFNFLVNYFQFYNFFQFNYFHFLIKYFMIVNLKFLFIIKILESIVDQVYLNY